MTLDLAAPSTFFGVVGQLPLKTEAFAQTRRVLGSGDEFSAGQVGAIPHPAYRAAYRRRSRPDSARHVKSSRAARAQAAGRATPEQSVGTAAGGCIPVPRHTGTGDRRDC